MDDSQMLGSESPTDRLRCEDSAVRRMLIVEDDVDIAPIIDRLAVSVCPGVVVDWARTLREARHNIGAHDYDFVLADFLLEDRENGLELQLDCANLTRPALFALMSAHPIRELKKQPDTRPFLFLAKPFSREGCQEFLELALR